MEPAALNKALAELEPSVAAEIREFAGRDPNVQLVYLYRELMEMKADIAALKRSRSLKDRFTDIGTAGALVAYLLFDQRDKLGGLGR